ncbi:hypothetical protein FQR65_LT14413 [Abscondita terminalis]|nr:hypothetical protein FQR65_LT14413 [Abscondita terminalis]
MSATFKNAKRKLSQAELRRYMNDHKVKKVAKIESPLAKYPFHSNFNGQLTCILCQSVVRSESVWNVHINSKQHRDKVEEAKRLKESTNNFTTPLKRVSEATIEVPTKKLKGILKNAGVTTSIDSGITVVQSDVVIDNVEIQKIKTSVGNEEKVEDMEVDSKTDNSVLPEGFFDDPKQDAKVNNIYYKDPIEEEWERFQKAIRDANNESATIIAEDHEEATNERQLDEIDEQMKNWSKVLTLEKKKTEIITTHNKEAVNMDQPESSGEEDNFEEYLDWRTKKVFV